MKEKPFRTHVQQVNILRKKGMFVPQSYGVDVLKRENKSTKAFEITDYWIDMGKPSDYEKIKEKYDFR